MNKNLPDKWIREAIFSSMDGMEINGESIPFYDSRVSGVDQPNYYVLMSTQLNEVDKDNKCEWFWDSEILLDVVTIYPTFGNPANREMAEDILNEMRIRANNMQLSQDSGLDIFIRTQSFPPDLSEKTSESNVYRKFLRLILKIK